ncbi:hypothetical protein P3T35_005422 [Kitasatospora sp. GP30]|uniref:hypothetical protein n=1 Tax=Kitasatospora sp. GP30 TaxID=3035084 RepID=UPI000CB895ED|nr:hypothetical protein [Kitasatospora sp. GP30]MDH6143387.1 hypothetical protein [Kitasatospora sp. GP30]
MTLRPRLPLHTTPPQPPAPTTPTAPPDHLIALDLDELTATLDTGFIQRLGSGANLPIPYRTALAALVS